MTFKIEQANLTAALFAVSCLVQPAMGIARPVAFAIGPNNSEWFELQVREGTNRESRAWERSQSGLFQPTVKLRRRRSSWSRRRWQRRGSWFGNLWIEVGFLVVVGVALFWKYRSR